MRYAVVPAALVALSVAGCGDQAPSAYGNPNSIIVATSDTLWAQVRDSMYSVLEPRIFAVRDERTFELTHADPRSPEWQQLRRWKQVLTIGRPDDPWMESVLSQAGGVPQQLPALVDATNVWARGQSVTALVLPAGASGTAVQGLLPELHDLLDRRFRGYVRERMFVSGVNEGIRPELRQDGFDLVIPEVYRSARADSVWVFRNDYPTAARQIRSVLVASRPGADSLRMEPEEVLAWRDSLAARYYQPPQSSLRERVETRRVDAGGRPALELLGVWEVLPGEFPGAGAFITRVVPCPSQNRTFLADAWLYAPGEDKYEFMLQLHSILDSFRCVTG